MQCVMTICNDKYHSILSFLFYCCSQQYYSVLICHVTITIIIITIILIFITILSLYSYSYSYYYYYYYYHEQPLTPYMRYFLITVQNLFHST